MRQALFSTRKSAVDPCTRLQAAPQQVATLQRSVLPSPGGQSPEVQGPRLGAGQLAFSLRPCGASLSAWTFPVALSLLKKNRFSFKTST